VTSPQFHGRRTSFSASKVLEAMGESLSLIKEQDDLTWKDVGRVLGRSDDRAAAYASGGGDMGVTSFLLGCREWNGRFANDALAMIGMKLVPIERETHSDRRFSSALARLQVAVNEALEDDNEIDAEEIEGMRALLDEVGRGVDCRRAVVPIRGAQA
jgi:hypothetical protein